MQQGEEIEPTAGNDGYLDLVRTLRDPARLPIDGDLRLLAARRAAAARRDVIVDSFIDRDPIRDLCDAPLKTAAKPVSSLILGAGRRSDGRRAAAIRAERVGCLGKGQRRVVGCLDLGELGGDVAGHPPISRLSTA